MSKEPKYHFRMPGLPQDTRTKPNRMKFPVDITDRGEDFFREVLWYQYDLLPKDQKKSFNKTYTSPECVPDHLLMHVHNKSEPFLNNQFVSEGEKNSIQAATFVGQSAGCAMTPCSPPLKVGLPKSLEIPFMKKELKG